MSPSAILPSSTTLPPKSATTTLLSNPSSSTHPAHLHNLALITLHNLQHQHDWTLLNTHTHSPLTGRPLPRPIVSGLPPKRIYIHPDEQIAVLKAAHDLKARGKNVMDETEEKESTRVNGGGRKEQEERDAGVDVNVNTIQPEREWVLPTQISEKWSLKGFASVFDALSTIPPLESAEEEEEREKDKEEAEGEREVGWQWRGENRQKRLLLATVNDDSTVVYYIIHDGIVKPRQN